MAKKKLSRFRILKEIYVKDLNIYLHPSEAYEEVKGLTQEHIDRLQESGLIEVLGNAYQEEIEDGKNQTS